jgi:hypothetical protein
VEGKGGALEDLLSPLEGEAQASLPRRARPGGLEGTLETLGCVPWNLGMEEIRPLFPGEDGVEETHGVGTGLVEVAYWPPFLFCQDKDIQVRSGRCL